jgi:hypothetical protein
LCVHFLRIPKRFQLARAASAPLKMEARLRAQCNPDLAEDVPPKLEQILKDRHNPDLSADEEAGRLTALLDGIADAEVRLDRLEAAKCQTCQRNPGVCIKPYKHVGFCKGNDMTPTMRCKTKGCMLSRVARSAGRSTASPRLAKLNINLAWLTSALRTWTISRRTRTNKETRSRCLRQPSGQLCAL